MNVGKRNKNRAAGIFCRIVSMVWVYCLSGYALAVDNPDAPDYVGDFKSRALVFEQDIHNTAHTTQGYRKAYAAYEAFLDKELNIAYSKLKTHLEHGLREALTDSQCKWLTYKGAAFEFVAVNWTTENFGSASVISRGDYRTTIIRDRVILLLHYLQNY